VGVENIPSKKYANATYACCVPIETETIIALVDNSYFGSAESSIIFGLYGIYIQQYIIKKPQFLTYYNAIQTKIYHSKFKVQISDIIIDLSASGLNPVYFAKIVCTFLRYFFPDYPLSPSVEHQF